jgi:2-amino-4-hydroxy-6-hydroxymethyldihydropteridine diphosphokinase
VTRYAIGLGSNMGDRLAHLIGACEQIEGEDKRMSSLYETEPVGGPDQDPYLNAVMVLESDKQPTDMLDHLQRIELEFGRERKVQWGPRTLDLDLIAADSGPVSTRELTLPHPRAGERAFVLRPLIDVWADAPVGGGNTAREALEELGDQGVDWLARDWVPPVSEWKAGALVAGQFLLFLAVAAAIAIDGTLPEGEVTVLRVLGAVLAMVGVIVAFISSRRLGPSMTASPLPKEGGSLVIAGPYRYARHPIYGGVTLTLLGTAMFLDSVAGTIIAALLIPYFWMKSSYEERQLRIRFPGYRAYQQVVHRRLIPFVL